jgi:hypothetical protein
MFSDRPIYPSLGAWRGIPVNAALAESRSASEPLHGKLSIGHAQVCPQNPGRLDPDRAQDLRLHNPDVQFRLHANAQVAGWSSQADASAFDQHEDYFRNLERVSQAFGAPVYTWHAGMRRHATLEQVLQRTRDLEQSWGIDVGIEGLYPTPDDRHLLSNWEEYRALLESGVKYALDMSHVNILVTRSGERDDGLLQDLLASPACIEVHLSGNAGDADTHGQLATEPWWMFLLGFANLEAVFFTEGGQTRPTYF